MNKQEVLDKIRQEGDFKVWVYRGMLCLIRRHPSLKHLCGYVGVERGHKLFKKGYTSIEDSRSYPRVHGGLTFANFMDGNVWFFGFDCAHAGDLSPFEFTAKNGEIIHDINRWLNAGEVYRDMDYVTHETELLARWIKGRGKKQQEERK